MRSKATKPKLTPAEHAQVIRNGIPDACVDYAGLEKLKNFVMDYIEQDQELFNAINKALPDSPPSSPSDFEWLSNFCDLIESRASRGEILEVAKMAGY